LCSVAGVFATPSLRLITKGEKPDTFTGLALVFCDGAALKGLQMKLPTWALRALSFVNSESERGEWQSGLLPRFEKNWYRLEVEKWRVPDWHRSYGRGHFDKELSAADLVRKRILETALDIEWDRQTSDTDVRPDQALKEVDRLNTAIGAMAGDLAGLFRARADLMHRFSLEDSQESEPCDPFDFWSAFESAMELPQFRGWAYVAQEEIQAFLRIARSQSRLRPRWPDLLDEITKRPDSEVFASDPVVAAVAGPRTKATEWSLLGRQLIAGLDDWEGTYPRGFLMGCLPFEQLATLAEVVFDAPESSFSGDQMRKLRDSLSRSKP